MNMNLGQTLTMFQTAVFSRSASETSSAVSYWLISPMTNSFFLQMCYTFHHLQKIKMGRPTATVHKMQLIFKLLNFILLYLETTTGCQQKCFWLLLYSSLLLGHTDNEDDMERFHVRRKSTWLC